MRGRGARQQPDHRTRCRPCAAPSSTATACVLATSVERYDITVDQRALCLYEQPVKHPDSAARTRGWPTGSSGGARARAAARHGLADAARTADRHPAVRVRREGCHARDLGAVAALDLPGIYGDRDQRPGLPGRLASAPTSSASSARTTGRGRPRARLTQQLAGTDGSAHLPARRPAAGRSPPATVDRRPGGRTGSDVTADPRPRPAVAGAAGPRRARCAETGAQSGTVVVMDPRTARSCALADAPDVRPERPGGRDQDDLGNRAPLRRLRAGLDQQGHDAAAALIEEGVVTPPTQIVVPTGCTRGRQGLPRRARRTAPEHLTFAGVLAKSSNIGTIMVGEKLGAEHAVRLPEEVRHRPARPAWASPARAAGSCAQAGGLVRRRSATRCRSARGCRSTRSRPPRSSRPSPTTACACQPPLVAGTTAPDGSVRPGAAPDRAPGWSAPQTATTVRGCSRRVVSEEGTAPRRRSPATGSPARPARRSGSTRRCGCYRGYTASFIGMAPADDPRLVVAVTLQRPGERPLRRLARPARCSSRSCRFALQSLQIPPTGTKAPRTSLVPR